MAQLPQLERGRSRGRQLGAHGPQPGPVTGPGHARIEEHQYRLQVLEGRRLRPHQPTELAEDHRLDFPLPSFEIADAIAQGNHRLGFHEHRAARRRTVVHQAGDLAGGAGLDRQHRPAIAFSHHRVLQQRAPAADQLLQALAPFRPNPLQLAPQPLQLGAGAIGHPAALLDREVEALLQLRQGAQVGHQGGGDGPEGGILNLAPQAAGGREGGGERQQLFPTGAAPLGAAGHGGGDVGDTAEAEAPLQHAIEPEQLGGFRQEGAAFCGTGGQRQGGAVALPGGGAGETGHMLRQPGPFEQGEGLGGDALPGRLLHP